MEEETTSLSPSQSPPAQTKCESPSSSKKRQSSIDPATGQKQTKRRAARACQSCRSRKVRCDVVEGNPCGNCRWDKVPCIIQESRRRKKNFLAGPPPHRMLTADALPGHLASALPLQVPETSQLVESYRIHPIYQHPIPLRSPAAGNVGFNFNLPMGQVGWPVAPPPPPPPPQQQQPQSTSNLEDPLQIVANVFPTLPPFIKKPPRGKFGGPEISYLQIKGALTILNERFWNLLLRAYAEHVHPFMPLVPIHRFLADVRGEQAVVSLLLYNAVAFAAAAFVDPRELQLAGFHGRRQARKILFTRTRLLYDFDWEDDRFTLVQSLLLMSYWYETPQDQKDTWHWMGIAVSLARTIGLHQNPAKNHALSPADRRVWKRVWWCCVMRDHMIALGMRRPMRINEDDFDVPMLDMEDFEFGPFPDSNRTMGADCKVARDMDVQRDLAKMCVEMAKLTRLISRVLNTQYLVSGRNRTLPESGTTEASYMLHPNKTLHNLAEVQAVHGDLQIWYASLPEDFAYRKFKDSEVTPAGAPMVLQLTLLHMVYHTAVGALHRPFYQLAPPAGVGEEAMKVQQESKRTVRDAANKIAIMASALLRHNLVWRLPTTGVTVILPATIIHLLDMQQPQPPEDAARTKAYVHACRSALEQLREVYAAAGYAMRLVAQAFKKGQAQSAADGFPPRSGPLGDASAVPMAMVAKQTTPPPESASVPGRTGLGMFRPSNMFAAKSLYPDAQATGDSPPASDQDSALSPCAPNFSSEDLFSQNLAISNGGVVGMDGWPSNGTEMDCAEADISQFIDFNGEGIGSSDGSMLSMFNPNGDQVVVGSWGHGHGYGSEA